MECEQVKPTGLSRIETVVILAALASFSVIPITMFRVIRNKNAILRCSTNLTALGKSMLTYANDHDGALPVAGGKGTRWGAGMRDWSAGSRAEAFGLDPNEAGGEATVSASLYLLVRYAEGTPESFLCPADKGVSQFEPALYGARDRGLTELWDFGPDPAKHCSFAYQMIYAPYKLEMSHEPQLDVAAADRNPWIRSPAGDTSVWGNFRPDLPGAGFTGTSEQGKNGNAVAHGRKGQNVWYLDDHVEFAWRAFCGLEEDNIYTVSGKQTGADPWGTPPKLGSQPANRKDSLLVNDPPTLRK